MVKAKLKNSVCFADSDLCLTRSIFNTLSTHKGYTLKLSLAIIKYVDLGIKPFKLKQFIAHHSTYWVP